MIIWNLLETLGYTTESLLNELKQPCTKLLSHCFWQKKNISCEHIFKQIKHSEGFCCSFNSNLENIYKYWIHFNSFFVYFLICNFNVLVQIVKRNH